MPEEFPTVNTNKFLDSSEEDVDVDKQVENPIRRIEAEEEERKEIVEYPLRRTKKEM